MLAAAVEASGSDTWGASLSLVLACTMSATRGLLARPGQVTESLTSEASLFLNLAAFHAADISLANQEAIVKDVFSSLGGIEPYAERCKFSQHLVLPLEPRHLFNLEALFC
jgi:hypothetical protein